MTMVYGKAMVFATWLVSTAVGKVPTVDGVFSDWTTQSVVASDVSGDATGAFDITKVLATTDGTKLYVCFDTGSVRNLQNGEKHEGTLKLVLELPSSRRLTIDLRGKTATLDEYPEELIDWSQLDFVCLPTFASDRYELRLDLRKLGATICQRVKLNFVGSDELARPVPIVLKPRRSQQLEISLAKENSNNVRVVNLNTLHQGLRDAGRSSSIKRLLAAAQGDIYCFQEEWDEVEFRRAAPRVLPITEHLHLHWFYGCGVATTLPLQPLPMELVPGAAVAVTLPSEKKLVVFSVHLKCCGFAGSREDQRRVEQTKTVAKEIHKLRNGDFGEKLKESGVVVVGDYNLVGSRTPLDILKSAGMADWLLSRLGDNSAFTWRRVREEDPFWPGRLDIVCYDETRLKPTNGCIVDTSRLQEQTLDKLKLYAHDSWASDHLMIVADFQLVD